MTTALKTTILLFSCLLTPWLLAAQCEASPLPVTAITTVFASPPKATPSDKSVDGPLLGNGDVGVTLNWDSERIRFFVSKNDFWKAMPEYPHGGPRPIGGLDLSIQGGALEKLTIEQPLDSATIKLLCPGTVAKSALSSWVDANRNILFVKGESLSKVLSVRLWARDGDHAVVESGTADDVTWVTRKFIEEGLKWPAMAAMALKKIRSSDGRDVVFALAACTNMERKDYVEHAVSLVKCLAVGDVDNLYRQHLVWWTGFWNLSSVKIGDPMLEKYYYGAQYCLASCSRNPQFPPGLYGNWITTDSPAWAGDYHLNYNYEAPWWGVYSSNQILLSEGYDAPMLDYIGEGKRHARELLGGQGVYYPVGIGPKGFCSSEYPNKEEQLKIYGENNQVELEGGEMFAGAKSDALFASMNMFMRFYSTYDLAYARKVLPYLFEVANFWDNYLVFENGRYVIYNDKYGELGPWKGKNWQKEYGDFNNILSLGMLRTFYKGIIDVCNELQTGSHRIARWQQILDHLSDYPTVEQNGEKRFMACERGMSTQYVGADYYFGYALVFPSGVISVDKDPCLFAFMQKEINRWSEDEKDIGIEGRHTWMPMYNGFEGLYTVASRMKSEPEKILRFMKRRIAIRYMKPRIEMTEPPNLWVYAYGGGIETCAGVVSCINEMLLRSYDGVIEVFPNWPVAKDASFSNLRAYGAFLVSSEKAKGSVRFVEIVSEQGKNLTLINPWPGQEAAIFRDGKLAGKLSGNRWNLTTAPRERILIQR